MFACVSIISTLLLEGDKVIPSQEKYNGYVYGSLSFDHHRSRRGEGGYVRHGKGRGQSLRT